MVGVASIVLVATDWPQDLARTVGALADRSPDGTQLVIVANGASDAQSASLAELDAESPGSPGVGVEVVWTSARLGHAAALNAGIRRASAAVVVLVDTSLESHGDLVTPLVAALDDPTVAVAGPFGLVSDDLRTFEEPPEGTVDVVAIEGYAQAFRRADYGRAGPSTSTSPSTATSTSGGASCFATRSRPTTMTKRTRTGPRGPRVTRSPGWATDHL